MKPQHFAVLTGLLAVMALILLVAGRPPAGVNQAAEKAPLLVTVIGEGESRVKPDQVTLTFGVSTWTQGASAAEAEALNLASVEQLQAAIRSAGADSSGIDPQRPVVAPLTREDYAGKTYLTGYQATSTVLVTLTNLARTDAVVAAGLANGATSLDATVYGLRDTTDARQKALLAATAHAKERATAVVQGQGRNLGALAHLEMLEEAAPTTDSSGSAGTLLFRVIVKATYTY